MASKLSQRTKRTLRTIIQVLISLCAAIPDVVAKVPLGATGAQILVVSGLVTHYFKAAEALPFFPDWLKLDESKPADGPSPDPAP